MMPMAIGNITNGINAELIRTNAGLLHGIRVSWSWFANVSANCFQSPEAQLLTFQGQLTKTLNVIDRDNSVDFINLNCNEIYTPRVRATYNNVGQFENGIAIFFGGSYMHSHNKDYSLL